MSANRLLGNYLCLLWLLLTTAAVFTVTDRFVDTVLLPKWYATATVAIGGSLFLLFYLLFCHPVLQWGDVYRQICRATNLVVFAEALLSILQFFEVAPRYGGFTVGTFDNLAGLAACLALSFPLGFMYFWESNRAEQAVFVVFKTTSILAIALNGSRIGLICMLLVLVLTLFKSRKQRLIFSALFLLGAIPAGALLFKTDSTRGRWFIIQRTFDMIKERPLTGWGHNGFMANYMNVQADYFANHPDSPYSLLADNIHHPLNEYLLIAVNYGVPAVVCLIVLIIITLVYCTKHNTPHVNEGKNILLAIIILSAFSYPLAYPFSLGAILLCVTLIFNAPLENLKIPKYIASALILLLVIWGQRLYTASRSNLSWKEAFSEESISEYEELYQEKKSDIAFLYNYAIELYQSGDTRLALTIAKEAKHYRADYDLQLLLGDANEAQGNHRKAIDEYQKAAHMCPSRVTPLYEVYMIYRKLNDTTNRIRIYEHIKEMKIKRMNTDVLKMLHMINTDIKQIN